MAKPAPATRTETTNAPDLLAALFGRSLPTAPEIICGTSKYLFEKNQLRGGAKGYRWNTTRFDRAGQLADHLKSGFAISTGALSGTRRQGCDVTAIYLMGADFDTLGIDQLLKNRFIVDYAAILYETASSTPTEPRSRALFILDTAITPAQFRVFIRRLLAVFGQDADPRCTDPARIWYGSTNPRYLVREGVILPVSVLEALPDPAPRQQQPASNSASPTSAPPSVESLVSFYLSYQSGRNDALFKTLQYARDFGITPDADPIQQLKRVFVNEPPRRFSGNTAGETPTAREKEFSATLTSVYQRPARPMTTLTPAVMLNAIRETLLQQKQDAAARLLDMLYAAGVTPGDTMTERQLVELCAPKGISRKTIRKALAATVRPINRDNPTVPIITSEGEIVQNAVFVPILYTPAKRGNTRDKTTCVVRCQNGDKNYTDEKPKEGRPSGTGKQYTIPTVDYLLDALNIERETAKHADAIPADAVKTASSYRRAIHTALVKRKPGQYSMRLLSQRLGVTRMTVYQYNKAAGIEGIPVYTRIPITWANVNELPFVDIADADRNKQGRRYARGAFIEDVTSVTDPAAQVGEKYSPFAVTARRLLSQRRTIYLCYREANSWVYRPTEKRTAPIFKMRPLTPAQPDQQPAALPLAAGAENSAPPSNVYYPPDADQRGGSTLNPFSRGSRANDRKSDDPPA